MKELGRQALTDLAKLCRIHCTEEELDILSRNLSSILGYIDQMQEVNTENVPVCTHVVDIGKDQGGGMRQDKLGDTLDREQFLRNSPSHVGGMIRVPTVIKF